MQAISPGIEFFKKDSILVCSHPPKNIAVGGFTSKSCSRCQRNVYKKRDTRADVQSCCFAHKTHFFLTLSLYFVVVVV